jgi:hypothetical protein
LPSSYIIEKEKAVPIPSVKRAGADNGEQIVVAAIAFQKRTFCYFQDIIAALNFHCIHGQFIIYDGQLLFLTHEKPPSS